MTPATSTTRSMYDSALWRRHPEQSVDFAHREGCLVSFLSARNMLVEREREREREREPSENILLSDLSPLLLLTEDEL